MTLPLAGTLIGQYNLILYKSLVFVSKMYGGVQLNYFLDTIVSMKF